MSLLGETIYGNYQSLYSPRNHLEFSFEVEQTIFNDTWGLQYLLLATVESQASTLSELYTNYLFFCEFL